MSFDIIKKVIFVLAPSTVFSGSSGKLLAKCVRLSVAQKIHASQASRFCKTS
jgi:hypothetical protein